MIKHALLATIGLGLGACAMDMDDPEIATESEAVRYKLKDYTNRLVGVTFTMATPLNIGPSCPSGDPPYALSYKICQDPVRYNCTAYYCNDASGRAFLANMPPGRSNPECSQDPFQTTECTSNPLIPEKFVPSREDLVDRAPLVFPRELLDVPLKPIK